MDSKFMKIKVNYKNQNNFKNKNNVDVQTIIDCNPTINLQ